MSTIVANTLNYMSDGIANAVSRWTERSAGVLAYFRSITASVNSVASSKRTNVKWKVTLPFPDDEPSSCPCPGEAPTSPTIVNIDVRFDSRASAAYRTAVLTTIKDLTDSAQFADSIEDLVLPT